MQVDLDLTDQWLNFDNLCKTVWSKIQSMLIIQPPINELRFYARCCERSERLDYAAAEASTLFSHRGITVGHVLRELAYVQRKHRLCPRGEPEDLDSLGDLYPKIEARGWIHLREDDKKVEKFMRERERWSAWR